MSMRIIVLTLGCVAAVGVGEFVHGDEVAEAPAAPTPILPQQLTWSGPSQVPGLQSAWVLGSETAAGPYVLRVRLAPGTRIPPHTHPDPRICTVLAGTVRVAFGSRFDPVKGVAMPVGAVYVLPAGVPHYVWTEEAAAEYQEAGTAPTGTAFLPAPAP